MVESLPMDDAGTQKRRSTRIVQAVPITVAGVDALGQPFKERTTTVMVNCHGCKYQSKHYVPKNSTIDLEIPHPEPRSPPAPFRAAWFGCSDREPYASSSRSVSNSRVREIFGGSPSRRRIGSPIQATRRRALPRRPNFPLPPRQSHPPRLRRRRRKRSWSRPLARASVTSHPATPAAESKVHVMPGPVPAPTQAPATSQESQLATARQMAKMVADAKDTLDKTLKRGAQSAINDEMTVVRQQLDAQLHDAVERAIKVSMERVSESAVKKVVQQAAERTAAIVEEARRASDTNAENLDAKVRQAVEQAVSNVADQAAQQAAEQAAAHNLKQAVEEAVERVVSQREAASPSLGILASPDAARQHLDQWKRDLGRDSAKRSRPDGRGGVRGCRRGQAALERRIRSRIDGSIAEPRAKDRRSIAGCAGAGGTRPRRTPVRHPRFARRCRCQRAGEDPISRLRSRAGTRTHGRGKGSTRGRGPVHDRRDSSQPFDDIAAVQHQEAVRQADRAIAERAQRMEPILRNSAQQVLEKLSGELDQKLAPKIDEAHRAASGLTEAGEQATRLQKRPSRTGSTGQRPGRPDRRDGPRARAQSCRAGRADSGDHARPGPAGIPAGCARIAGEAPTGVGEDPR